MGLYFHNEAGSPISLVYGYSAPECEGGVTWAKKGLVGQPRRRGLLLVPPFFSEEEGTSGF